MSDIFHGFIQHVQEKSSVDNRTRTRRDSTIAGNHSVLIARPWWLWVTLLADLVSGIQNAALCRKNAVRSKEHTNFRTLCVGGPPAGSAESVVYATGKKVIRYLKRRYYCLPITQ